MVVQDFFGWGQTGQYGYKIGFPKKQDRRPRPQNDLMNKLGVQITMEHELIKNFNLPRISRLMKGAVVKFDLSLKGLEVLTEAATGYFMFTPIIAAVAGAAKVYALTKDSRYGKASDIRDATMALARHFGTEQRVEVISSSVAPEIANADIVTNLGHVRPLDKSFLSRMKKTAVIPLMYEAWEWRPEDLDLLACRGMGLPVLATNEEHERLQTMRFVGHLSLKLLFELDIEIFDSRIVVLGSGKFGGAVARSLRDGGSSVSHMETESPEVLKKKEVLESLRQCEAVVIAEHVCREQLIGPSGPISGENLRRLNPSLVLAHIAGNVDQEDIKRSGLIHRPEKFARSGYMSMNTGYLGPRPCIDLHTAGLKIGEIMARARLGGKNRLEAEKAGLKLGFAETIPSPD